MLPTRQAGLFCCAPDCVEHDLSTHEEIRGIEAEKERVRAYRAAMPDLRVSIDDVFASGDEVVLRWTARGTNDGELMGNQPTHRRVEITGISTIATTPRASWSRSGMSGTPWASCTSSG